MSSDTASTLNEPPTEWSAAEAELLAKARALAPALRERAGEAERLRRLPDATQAAFREAGFYRILQPARYGGLEARYGLQTMLGAEAARGCASSGWALSITASHSWILGMFPREAQDEFWNPDPQRTLASSFLAVQPSLTPQSGGIRLSGRWRFSSNVDHCDGIILLVTAPGAGGAPRQTFAFLHRDQYEIEDTWHVVGLAATGSNDVVVRDAFVPEHRLLELMSTREGRTPGAQANPHYLFSLPLFASFAHCLVGAALGAAEGALDQTVDSVRGKTSVANVRLAEQPTVQTRIAEAAAEIAAARALLQVDRARINDRGRLRILPDDETRVRYRLDVGYAAKLSVQAIERLLPIVGGRGLELADPFQRAWRDAHAVAQHIALVWDLQALNYGAVRLGGKAGDPRI
ncbi:MAG TPA: acyl-CoA dehydrogenase family protein [Xanthobacteraceae bacterium]|nr:acyl-CoA dehydrogenase family protein [Xanthobacteraceae bacterium]